jgi:hypothetical protein
LVWRQGDYPKLCFGSGVRASFLTLARNAPRQSNGVLISVSISLEIGGKGIRTPDFQLAKLALYQLSYAPGRKLIVDG